MLTLTLPLVLQMGTTIECWQRLREYEQFSRKDYHK